MQTLALINNDYKDLFGGYKEINIKLIRDSYSFRSFIKADFQLYKHNRAVILQRSLIQETDSELTELLEQMLIIYDIEIILIYPSAPDSFLKKVLSLNIYNIVTSADPDEQAHELEECVSSPENNALKWIRIFPELVGEQEEQKVEKKKRRLPFVLPAAVLVAFTVIGSTLIFLRSLKSNADTTAKENVSQKESFTETSVTLSVPSAVTSAIVSQSTTKPSSTPLTERSEGISETPTSSVTEAVLTKAATVSVSAVSQTSTAISRTTTAASTAAPPAASQVTTARTSSASTTMPAKTTTTTKSTTAATENKAVTTTTTTSKVTTTTTTTVKTTTTAIIIHVNSISIDSSPYAGNVTLKMGEFYKMTAIVLPEYATDRSVNWSSNKPQIAQVDSSGNVTGITPGKAIIKATTIDGELTAACMVTVMA